MRTFSLTVIILILSACAPDTAPTDDSAGELLSVILERGDVYSGEDAAPVVADVGIRGDRIVAIGDLGTRQANLRLDVSGLAVVPGFIDIHSHAIRDDPEDGIFRWPDAENQIRQGVTTVIGGPDGGSPLPISDTLNALEQRPAAVNFATFVGHGSIRGLIVGEDDRPPSDEELEAMRGEVSKAMEQGAFGLSSGLIYPPGRFASTEEVIELAKVAAE
jgi:dihydroorotase/N-acyl-D-amino-acid deacylase